jgi:hypothetical protein
MYKIISYDKINGSKTQGRDKLKLVKSIEYIDRLQSRAERLWNLHLKDSQKITVLIHFVRLDWRNPKSENIGKEGFKLEKWM